MTSHEQAFTQLIKATVKSVQRYAAETDIKNEVLINALVDCITVLKIRSTK